MSKQPPKRLDNASGFFAHARVTAGCNPKQRSYLRRRGHDPQVDEKTSKEDEKSTTTVKRNDAIAINYFENDLKEVAPVSKDWLHNLQQTFVIKRLLCSDLMLSEEEVLVPETAMRLYLKTLMVIVLWNTMIESSDFGDYAAYCDDY
ncbi:15982_t:CDS:2 [Rhizophagus irregularis]|nr:15982_t:CDS:2 [Rhizophagus irregularis]